MPRNLSTTRPAARLIILLLIVSVLVGLQFRLSVVFGTEVDSPLRTDAGQYYAYAYNLRNHGVYSQDLSAVDSAPPHPDYFRNPGYPLLLLPFAGDPPDREALLKIALLQALMSTIVILLIYFAARAALPATVAAVVAFLTAISPHLINANVYILSESAAVFTTVLFLVAFIHFGLDDDGVAPLAWVLCGALLGIATLVRPTMQWFLLPALFLIYYRAMPNSRRRSLWLVLGFLLLMAPWWLRNLLHFGNISDPSLMIATLHHGMYPGFMYAGQPETFGYPYRFDPRSPEITQSLASVLAEIARRFAEEPSEHLQWFMLSKPLMFWNWSNEGQGAAGVFIYPVVKTPFTSSLPLFVSHEAMYWLHWPLVALGMIGCLLCWSSSTARLLGEKPTWAFRVTGTILLYFLVLHTLGAPFSRYSIPILPILYLQAAGTCLLAFRLIRPSRR